MYYDRNGHCRFYTCRLNDRDMDKYGRRVETYDRSECGNRYKNSRFWMYCSILTVTIMMSALLVVLLEIYQPFTADKE